MGMHAVRLCQLGQGQRRARRWQALSESDRAIALTLTACPKAEAGRPDGRLARRQGSKIVVIRPTWGVRDLASKRSSLRLDQAISRGIPPCPLAAATNNRRSLRAWTTRRLIVTCSDPGSAKEVFSRRTVGCFRPDT